MVEFLTGKEFCMKYMSSWGMVPLGAAVFLLAALLMISCATPQANSPVINVHKTAQTGNFTGDCMKDDEGVVHCPSIIQKGSITSTYTTTSDIKPKVAADQKTTASPTFKLDVGPLP